MRGLAVVLSELRPADVIVTHPADTHPDHAATYGILRDAIEGLPFVVRVHRAIVHNGDCWPNGVEPKEPCADTKIDPRLPTMALTGRLAGYLPRERLAVPESCLVADPTQNKKLRAIAAHASQTRGRPDSYLFGFARKDETFFPERFELSGDFRLPYGGKRIAGPWPYELEIDIAHHEARVVRKSAGAKPKTLATWPLPHDVTPANVPDQQMIVDERADDGVTEITVRFCGAVLGVAIDLSASPSARRER